MRSKKSFFNSLTQVALPSFTIVSFFLTSAKLPQYGVIAGLIAQIFWTYSSYRAWKEANQIGILVNTMCITLILLYGVINYWFL